MIPALTERSGAAAPHRAAPANESRWAGFGGDEFEIVARHATPRTFAKGAVVISEGDEAHALYLILSGSVKVYTTTRDGREIILRLAGPGEYFGVVTLFDGETRAASVKTTEACKLLVLPKSQFLDCCWRHPELYLRLLKDMSARVRQLAQELKQVASMDVYQRFTKLLLELAVREGDKLVVAQRLTQQELAGRICASREMVSRILRGLAAGGYITLDDRRIVINKKLPAKW